MKILIIDNLDTNITRNVMEKIRLGQLCEYNEIKFTKIEI